MVNSNSDRQARLKEKALVKLVDRFNEEGVTILVEGKRDVAALSAVRIAEGNVMTISHRSPQELASLLKGGTVVMLTDFDAAGEKLMKRFCDALSGAGNVKVDTESRKKLRWIFGIRTIEDLPTAYEEFMGMKRPRARK